MVGARERYRLWVSPFPETLRTALQALRHPVTVITLDGEKGARVEFDTSENEPALTRVIDTVRAHDCEITGLRVEEVPLEDVFAHVTEER